MSKLRVSYSGLTATVCSTRALLRFHGYTSPDEALAAFAGQVAHEALAQWLGGATIDDAIAHFEATYQPTTDIDPSSWQARLLPENLATILRVWMERHPIDSLPLTIDPKLVEVEFTYPLTDAIDLHGIMDVIGKDQFNLWWVWDWKTTGRIDAYWAKGFLNDAQMSTYVWGAEQVIGETVAGAYIQGIEFSKLPTDTVRKCRTHAMPYAECQAEHVKSERAIVQRNPAQIEEWRKTAVHLAERLERLVTTYPKLDHVPLVRTQGQFFGACRFCDFHDFCAVGRPMAQLGSMLAYDPERDKSR